MKKICVIGSSGYIGSSIVDKLASRYNVIAHSRNKNHQNIKIFKYVKGDLKNKKTIEKIARLKPEFIVYAASYNHFKSEKSLENTLRNNNYPLINLCNKLRKNKNFCKLIYFSSFQVFGDYQKIDIVNEETNKNPNNFYGLSHSLNEEYLKILKKKYNLQFDIIRLTNAYGFPKLKSCDCWWLVINDFCKNVVNNNKIEIKSNGKAFRNFINLDDVSNFVELILKNNKSSEVYNLASDETIQIKGLAKEVVKSFDFKKNFKGPKLIIQNKNQNIQKIKLENPKFKIDTKKLKKIGFRTKVKLKKGLKMLLKELYKEKIKNELKY